VRTDCADGKEKMVSLNAGRLRITPWHPVLSGVCLCLSVSDCLSVSQSTWLSGCLRWSEGCGGRQRHGDRQTDRQTRRRDFRVFVKRFFFKKKQAWNGSSLRILQRQRRRNARMCTVLSSTLVTLLRCVVVGGWVGERERARARERERERERETHG
jgi:hypothetical protein